MNFCPLHRILVALFLGAFVSSTGFATLVAWDSSSANPSANTAAKDTSVGSITATDTASAPQTQMNSNSSIPDYLQLDQSGQSSKVDVTAASQSVDAASSVGSQAAQTSGSAFNDKFVSVPDFGAYQYIALASSEDESTPAAFSDGTTPVPEMNALLPIVGLVAAVASTQILRRRRAARNLLQA